MATTCPTMEDQKPRAAKLGTKSADKDVKSPTSSPEKSEEQSEAAGSGGDESMKALIDEASRMLKSMNEGEAKERRQKGEDAEQTISNFQVVSHGQQGLAGLWGELV